MAKFTPQQAADVLAIKQVVYEWGDELDIHNGLEMRKSDVLAEDVAYNVGGEWREGLKAVETFYQGRAEALRAGAGLMTMRHIITSLRVSFDDADNAKVGYLLVFFAAQGEAPFDKYCDPLAVADVKMECRRDPDGEWRITRFDSGQIFRRG
ncbi:nuclear transport factor 2 family protein [Novosphingobium sp. BL-8A]|uniref:nuclear transport factor 2 family protein n=1 Tax=Novosphingobium sp. BL-8A TaxID=3127639 RepID=UPI00375733DD